MFNLEEERRSGDDWAHELQADLADQVRQWRPRDIVVDDWTALGRVFIFFRQEGAAEQCRAVMHGRHFAGRQITAHVITDAQGATALATRPA
jgi:hypothetical protein